ncbi:MAG TPA: recombinase family protein [Steroidobacteraceae bacterium]|jgi:DNA invertase Pin-like site-specific DNA recombinase|nr:recombinase family protein [Steroidobacteraceae bacterium]
MVPKQKRVGIYLRVSQADQTTDNQRIDLERVAEQRGWDITEVYLDHGVSGKRDRRPALDRLRKDALHGKLDVVAAWSVDRLGRSVAHVVTLLHDLTEQKVAVYLHQQQVDGTTSAGKAMLAMCAVFSEFEWNTTSDRIKAGIVRARKEGKRIGRPTSVTAKTESQIRKLRADHPKLGIIKIAKQLGCGVSTVQRVLAGN